MSSRSLIVIELPEGSCSPQVLESILRQVREFFDRLSSGLYDFTGQRLKVTIGPWEGQHCVWAGDCSVEVAQNSQNNTSTPTSTTIFPGNFARNVGYGASLAQDDGVHTLVQQQGFDGQAFVGESRELGQHSTQVVNLENHHILFPDHNIGIPYSASSLPFIGQSHFPQNNPQRFNVDTPPLQPLHQILPSNAATLSQAQQNEVSPRTSDEILIRRAANNLSARPVSDLAVSPVERHHGLRWAIPSAPADYMTPGPGGPSESRSASRQRGQKDILK